MANEVRLMEVQMLENDINASTVGEFLKMLLLQLWREAEGFSGKRPFGNSDWQYQVYASLINAGYEVGELDEDGYVETVDREKADKLIADAITAVFGGSESLRPKGRWVYDEKNMEMACSECLCAAHVRCGDRYNYILSDYCPNCGAKMEG